MHSKVRTRYDAGPDAHCRLTDSSVIDTDLGKPAPLLSLRLSFVKQEAWIGCAKGTKHFTHPSPVRRGYFLP